MKMMKLCCVLLFMALLTPVSLANNLLYKDDFDEGTAEGWTYAESFWTIRDGWLLHTTTEEENLAWVGDTEWTDYDFSLRLRIDEYGAEMWTGARIVVRWQDYDNFVVVLMSKDGGVGLHWRNPETGWDQIASGGSWNVFEGEEYEVLVSVRGNEYEVYIDDVYVIGAVDERSRAPKGAVGIYGAKTEFGVTDLMVRAAD